MVTFVSNIVEPLFNCKKKSSAPRTLLEASVKQKACYPISCKKDMCNRKFLSLLLRTAIFLRDLTLNISLLRPLKRINYTAFRMKWDIWEERRTSLTYGKIYQPHCASPVYCSYFRPLRLLPYLNSHPFPPPFLTRNNSLGGPMVCM